MFGTLLLRLKRIRKTKASRKRQAMFTENGHTSLFADVMDAIVNDRKPYV